MKRLHRGALMQLKVDARISWSARSSDMQATRVVPRARATQGEIRAAKKKRDDGGFGLAMKGAREGAYERT